MAHDRTLNKEHPEVRQLRKYNESGLTTHGGAAMAAPLSRIHTCIQADTRTPIFPAFLPLPRTFVATLQLS